MTMFLRSVSNEKLYLAFNIHDMDFGASFVIFRPSDAIAYHPYCDDFGPMNMSSVIDFIEELNASIRVSGARKIVYKVNGGRRELTNAVFLLGAFMIFRDKLSSAQVSTRFHWLDKTLLEPYCDITNTTPNFHLQLIDCWQGLEKGRNLGWARMPAHLAYLWGQVDEDDYRHYDNPLEGNLHEVIPGRFVAFQSPVDLGGADYCDHPSVGRRDFSPAFYAPALYSMGVRAVVCLCDLRYDPADFQRHGIAHHHLPFPDGTAPSREVVRDFLRVVDTTQGSVAVHCHAGLGRTGTLIAVSMMLSHGFTAHQAMGWLRVMRPGSVMGPQQAYLCGVDRLIAAHRAVIAAAPRRSQSAPSPPAPKSAIKD